MDNNSNKLFKISNYLMNKSITLDLPKKIVNETWKRFQKGEEEMTFMDGLKEGYVCAIDEINKEILKILNE